jgi:hypothetical protein
MEAARVEAVAPEVAPQGNGAGPATALEPPVVPVSQAFSLGWNVCLLYLANTLPTWEQWEDAPERLPAPSDFSAQEQSLIRLGQIRSAIDRFNGHFARTDGNGSLLAAAGGHLESLSPHAQNEGEQPDPRRDLYKAHLALSRALSAGDARLAKAYQVGVSLAAICNSPQNPKMLGEEFDRLKIAQLGEGLADLSSLFPDHSSRAVRLSCGEWRRWVEKPEFDPLESPGQSAAAGAAGHYARAKAIATREPPRKMEWARDGEEIRAALVRQGEVWRALLSGEKSGTAMLELHAYFATGVRALKHGVRLLRGVLVPILVAVALLLFGSFLLVKDPGAGATALGVVTVAGAVGITWKGILGGLGSVASRLQKPVWGAALDEEIAAAITLLPTGARAVSEEAEEAAPAPGPPPDAFTAGDAGSEPAPA